MGKKQECVRLEKSRDGCVKVSPTLSLSLLLHFPTSYTFLITDFCFLLLTRIDYQYRSFKNRRFLYTESCWSIRQRVELLLGHSLVNVEKCTNPPSYHLRHPGENIGRLAKRHERLKTEEASQALSFSESLWFSNSCRYQP